MVHMLCPRDALSSTTVDSILNMSISRYPHLCLHPGDREHLLSCISVMLQTIQGNLTGVPYLLVFQLYLSFNIAGVQFVESVDSLLVLKGDLWGSVLRQSSFCQVRDEARNNPGNVQRYEASL